MSDDVYRIVVEDNGPGIIPAQIPYVFGKLLYGSRFHQIRQSRGQQGIGISAAVLYAQLTTGIPSLIISRTTADEPAQRFTLRIKTESNEPEIVAHEEVEWDRSHGTRVQIEFKSTLAAKKRLLEYLKFTSVVNPHARLRVVLDDESFIFERASNEVIACPASIAPHPHGIEIGQLQRMIAASDINLLDFLVNSFSRVGKKTAEEIAKKAGLSDDIHARSLSVSEQKRLLAAMQEVRVPAPLITSCLSPIGEELIVQGLEKEFVVDFARAKTRPVSVHSGHPFIVEAALCYGGRLAPEGNAQILRFANRVPLMYQQGACTITGAILEVNWKVYGITQQGLPIGPLLILVHVASTNVPFTSESKDAIAAIPEINREIVLALQELGRELKSWLSRREKNKAQDTRARAVCAILPEIARKVSEIVELPVPDVSAIEGKIMRKVIVKRWSMEGKVSIELANYSGISGEVSIYLISGDPAHDAVPAPHYSSELEGEYTKVWKVPISPGRIWKTTFSGHGGGSLSLRGVEEGALIMVDLDD